MKEAMCPGCFKRGVLLFSGVCMVIPLDNKEEIKAKVIHAMQNSIEFDVQQEFLNWSNDLMDKKAAEYGVERFVDIPTMLMQ